MWIRLTLTMSLLIACCAWALAGEPHQTKPPDLPASIAELKSKIQGKKPAEVLEIIQAQFGSDARNIASGLPISILQWDVAGGVLTFHPWLGPTFSRGKSNVMLIDTRNEVGDNIPGDYHMSTLPDNSGIRFWIGDVVLQADGTYRFKRVVSRLSSYTKDASNFFIDHPNGTYAVSYPKTVEESSLMENLPDKSAVATLEFVADPPDKPADETHTIDLRIDILGRTIYFAPHIEKPLTYQVEKTWNKFWNY